MNEPTTEYSVCVICQNCKSERYYSIPLGTSIKDFLTDEVCIKCGCNVIEEEFVKIGKEDEDES
jgi:superfamily II helicase